MTHELETTISIEDKDIESVIVYSGNTRDFPEIEIESLFFYDPTKDYCAPQDVSFLIPVIKSNLIDAVEASL